MKFDLGESNAMGWKEYKKLIQAKNLHSVKSAIDFDAHYFPPEKGLMETKLCLLRGLFDLYSFRT